MLNNQTLSLPITCKLHITGCQLIDGDGKTCVIDGPTIARYVNLHHRLVESLEKVMLLQLMVDESMKKLIYPSMTKELEAASKVASALLEEAKE